MTEVEFENNLISIMIDSNREIAKTAKMMKDIADEAYFSKNFMKLLKIRL